MVLIRESPAFLNEFGGPATFYTLLNKRHRSNPLFLHRNLATRWKSSKKQESVSRCGGPHRRKRKHENDNAVQSGMNIYYHYLHPDSEERNGDEIIVKRVDSTIEKRADFRCPWCPFMPRFTPRRSEISSDALFPPHIKECTAALFYHLHACHYHCNYEFMADDSTGTGFVSEGEQVNEMTKTSPLNMNIFIRRNSVPLVFGRNLAAYKYDEYPDLSASFTFLNDKKFPGFKEKYYKHPLRGTLKIPAFRIKEIKETPETEEYQPSLSSPQEGPRDEEGAASAAAPLPLRYVAKDWVYNNARLGASIAPGILQQLPESDNEMDSEIKRDTEPLCENEGISFDEKELMRLWNMHVTTFPPYDHVSPAVCERFVRRFAPSIYDKKLRRQCLLHFSNLYDSGLITADEMKDYMMILDEYAEKMKYGCTYAEYLEKTKSSAS